MNVNGKREGNFPEKPKTTIKKPRSTGAGLKSKKELKCLGLAEKISTFTPLIDSNQISFFKAIWKGTSGKKTFFSKVFSSDNAIRRVLISLFQSPVEDVCYNPNLAVFDQKYFLYNFFKNFDAFPPEMQAGILNWKKNIIPYYYALSSKLQNFLWKQDDSIKEKLREIVFRAWYRGNFAQAPFDQIFCLSWRADFWPRLLLDSQTQQMRLQPQAKAIVKKFALFLTTRPLPQGPYLSLISFIITSYLTPTEKLMLMKALGLPLKYGCDWKDFNKDSLDLEQINASIDWEGCNFSCEKNFSLSDSFALCQGDFPNTLALAQAPLPNSQHYVAKNINFTPPFSVSKALKSLKELVQDHDKQLIYNSIFISLPFNLDRCLQVGSTFEKIPTGSHLQDKYMRSLKKVVKRIAYFSCSSDLLKQIGKNFPEEALAGRAFRIQSIFEDHLINSSLVFEWLWLSPTPQEWKAVLREKNSAFFFKKLYSLHDSMRFIWDNIFPSSEFSFPEKITILEKFEMRKEAALNPLSGTPQEQFLEQVLTIYATKERSQEVWGTFLDKLYAEHGFSAFQNLFLTNKIVASCLKDYTPFMLEYCLKAKDFNEFYRFIPFLKLSQLKEKTEAITAILAQTTEKVQTKRLSHLIKMFTLPLTGKKHVVTQPSTSFCHQDFFALLKGLLDSPRFSSNVKFTLIRNVISDDLMADYAKINPQEICTWPISESLGVVVDEAVDSKNSGLDFVFGFWRGGNPYGPSISRIFLMDLAARRGNEAAQKCMALAMVGLIGNLSPWFEQYHLQRRLHWIENYVKDPEWKNFFTYFLKGEYFNTEMKQIFDVEFIERVSKEMPGVLALMHILKLTAALAHPNHQRFLSVLEFPQLLKQLHEEMSTHPVNSLPQHFSALAYHFLLLFDCNASIENIEISRTAIKSLKTLGLLPSVTYDCLLHSSHGQRDEFFKKVSINCRERLLPQPLFILGISLKSCQLNNKYSYFYAREFDEERLLLLENQMERSLSFYQLRKELKESILLYFQIAKLNKYFSRSLAPGNLKKCQVIINQFNKFDFLDKNYYNNLYLSRVQCLQRQAPYPNDSMLLAQNFCMINSAMDGEYKLSAPIFKLLSEPILPLPDMTAALLEQRAQKISWGATEEEEKRELKAFLGKCHFTEPQLALCTDLKQTFFHHLVIHLTHFLQPTYQQQYYTSQGMLLITEHDWSECKIKLQHILNKFLSLPQKEGDERLLDLLKDASACITQQKEAIIFCYSTNILDLVGQISAKSWIDSHIQQFKESCPSLVVKDVLPPDHLLNIHDKVYCSNVVSKAVGLKPLMDTFPPTFLVGDQEILLDRFLSYFRPQAVVDVISGAIGEAQIKGNTSALNSLILYCEQLKLKINDIFDEEAIYEGKYTFTPAGGFLLLEAMGYITRQWQKEEIFLDACF